MEADYGLELGPAAPALEIPWQDPEGLLHYVDLRECGSQIGRDLGNRIDSIPEAQQFPALRQFLMLVNSAPSGWQTAKCDVWADETNAAENLYSAGFTQSCYVDLVLAKASAHLRDNLEVHKSAAQELAQRLDADEELDAFAEIVVRRCYFHTASDPEASDAGYCLTLFLIGYGAEPAAAEDCWARATDLAAQWLLKVQPHEG